MKHGKKPTDSQRKMMEAEGLNWREWLVTKVYPNTIVVYHRQTGEIKVVEKREHK